MTTNVGPAGETYQNFYACGPVVDMANPDYYLDAAYENKEFCVRAGTLEFGKVRAPRPPPPPGARPALSGRASAALGAAICHCAPVVHHHLVRAALHLLHLGDLPRYMRLGGDVRRVRRECAPATTCMRRAPATGVGARARPPEARAVLGAETGSASRAPVHRLFGSPSGGGAVRSFARRARTAQRRRAAQDRQPLDASRRLTASRVAGASNSHHGHMTQALRSSACAQRSRVLAAVSWHCEPSPRTRRPHSRTSTCTPSQCTRCVHWLASVCCLLHPAADPHVAVQRSRC